jgi:hypothetical protein
MLMHISSPLLFAAISLSFNEVKPFVSICQFKPLFVDLRIPSFIFAAYMYPFGATVILEITEFGLLLRYTLVQSCPSFVLLYIAPCLVPA